MPGQLSRRWIQEASAHRRAHVANWGYQAVSRLRKAAAELEATGSFRNHRDRRRYDLSGVGELPLEAPSDLGLSDAERGALAAGGRGDPGFVPIRVERVRGCTPRRGSWSPEIAEGGLTRRQVARPAQGRGGSRPDARRPAPARGSNMKKGGSRGSPSSGALGRGVAGWSIPRPVVDLRPGV